MVGDPATEDIERSNEAVEHERAPSRSAWGRADRIAIVLVVLVAAVMRLSGLSHPDELIFDETYYAKDACWYVNSSEAQCARGADAPEVHPPLGKWLIGIGIRLFGFDCPDPENQCQGTTTSFAWRIVPALAGIATVALLYLLARRLFDSTLAAIASSGLLAFDFLHFVQSRTSMLDIFVPLFGVAAFYLLVLDRDRITGREAVSSLWDRPWRLAAGAAIGAAIATKWSGAFLLVAAIVLTAAWELWARRETPIGSRLARVARTEGPTILVYLLIVPILLYTLTYAGRIGDAHLLGAPWKEGHVTRVLWDHHRYMLGFHRDLESQHSYQSPGWSWILLKRPVSYYFCSGDSCTPPNEGEYEEIFASGNPFVWWTSMLALLYAAYRWVRRRNPAFPEGIILAGFLFSYLPWLLTDRPAVFIFYLLPTVPFMCLALGYITTKIGRSWEATSAVSLFAIGTVGVFGFYYPLLAGKPIPQPEWDARIWIFDNCDKPPGETVTTTITETLDGETQTRVEETTSDTGSVPPTGWCWI